MKSKEEKNLMHSIENENWKEIKNVKEKKLKYKKYAAATLRKDKRINIRISKKDLEELQKKAIYEGLPYQTLIYSVLHKYINGRLVEK